MADFIFERNMDISKRGPNCKVFDLDSRKVDLSKARVWFDDKGNYVQPRETFCPCTIS